ncbi:17551_t:CDS:2, partial [Entrophospora sp. SA101]
DRRWSNYCVKFLWRKPFESKGSVKILINCLKHYSKRRTLLRKDDVQLNFELLEADLTKPLYNYAAFAKRLAIFEGYSELVKGENISKDLKRLHANLLIKNLVNLILKSAKIKEIYLDYLTIPYLPNNFHKNSGLHFKNIKILHYNYDNTDSPGLLNNFVGIANKIEKLSVEIKKSDEAGDGLGELISQQSELKIMHLLVEQDCSLFRTTLEALLGKSGSLIEFRGYIHTMDEMLKEGAEFTNMKKLYLFNHYDDGNISMTSFKDAKFPQLEEFHFQFNAEGDIDDLIQFIGRNGSNLKVIVIEGNPDENSLELFIEKITITCRNLKYLYLPTSYHQNNKYDGLLNKLIDLLKEPLNISLKIVKELDDQLNSEDKNEKEQPPFKAKKSAIVEILLKVAGVDATKQFDNFHNLSTLEKYSSQLCIGEIGSGPTEETIDEAFSGDGPFGDLVPHGDPYWYQDFYSPYYNDNHRRVRAAVRVFVEKEIMPYAYEWDEAKRIPKELFIKMADAGILAGVVDFDHFAEFVLSDELARCGSGGILWGLTGGLGIGLPPILKFGSEELKKRVVPECLSGHKNICLAITEPYAGSDVANIKTEAKLSDDGQHYIVNGEKKWITNGTFADYFTTAVRTGGPGMGGISLLLIERTMPGVNTRQMLCSGVWSSGTAYITFDDVKVPKRNLVGKENGGFKCIMHNFNHERMGIAIQATRFARVCYEEAMKYAHKRKTFGQKLVDHAVIRNKLAHMARKIEATHAWMETLIYQTNHMSGNEAMTRLGGPIALLKAQSTQTFEYCAREAAQIFGGLAYTRGGQAEKVERLYREVRAYAIPGGSEEIMLDLGVRQSLKVAQFYGAKL